MLAPANQSQRYGIAVLVSFVWHVVALAGAWLNTTVGREDSSCDDASAFCFTAQDGAELLFGASAAFLVVSMLASLAIAAPLSRRIRSAVLAGTVSALAGGALVIVVLIALFVVYTVR